MITQAKRSLRIAGLLFVTALIAACATQPTNAPREKPQTEVQADQAAAAGNHAQAALLYREAAKDATTPLKEQLLLSSAEQYLDADQSDPAREVLKEIPDKDLPAALLNRRQVVLARLVLQQQQPERALQLLANVNAEDPAVRARVLAVRAEALKDTDRPLPSAEALVERDKLLTDEQARERNRKRIWETLNQTPMPLLRERMPPAPDQFGGWLELAFLVRVHRLNFPELETAVRKWQERYPDHPANKNIVPETLQLYREKLREPAHIGLLLPLSGQLADAGKAVRDGFMAAYYGVPADKRPVITVYDVGEQGRDPWSAYLQAIQDGAEMVVGPLTKPAVKVFSEGASLPVPVLALNTLPGQAQPASGLYQFGLPPEDEARQAAQYGAAHGYSHAVVLVPQGDWGDRVRQAFATRFQELGGSVLESADYPPGASDFSDPIQELLNLDNSTARYRRLERVLGAQVEFEARRRQDVDFMFIGAFPREARLIRPQIRFYHGIDLPVIATSQAYSGTPDPNADQDMDGLVFFGMPWVFADNVPEAPNRARLAALWPNRVARFPRLYALGIDAYRLVPHLDILYQYPDQRLDGVTGQLRMNAQGRIERELLPARFVDGKPELIEQEPASPATVP